MLKVAGGPEPGIRVCVHQVVGVDVLGVIRPLLVQKLETTKKPETLKTKVDESQLVGVFRLELAGERQEAEVEVFGVFIHGGVD